MGWGRRSLLTVTLGLLTTFAMGVAPSQAQTWPQRTVKFIVTLGPGSGADIGARLLADRLSKRWGQPVVVENRPGGDGIVGVNAFVSAHDDHILMFTPSSAFTAHPFMHANLPYKPSDLAPIARVSNTLIGISVPVGSPLKSLADLVAAVRAKPGALNWAGVTGALDFLFEGWLKATHLDMKKVPYRNPVEAANDLGENRVQVYESAIAIVRPQLQAKKIRLIAVTNSVRAPMAADVPTVKEAGYPALELDGLVGLFGPPSMPMALRQRIAGDIKAVMDADPVVKDRLTLTGQVVNWGGPEEFGASIDGQRARIAAAAKDLGIKAMQ